MAPLASKFSRKGDIFSALVLEPEFLKGALLEGEVRELKGGSPGSKSAGAVVEISTLHSASKTAPVTATLMEASSSRGQEGVDDNGHVIEGLIRPGTVSKVRAGSGPVRLIVKGDDLSLGAGSTLVFQIQIRDAR